MLILFWVILKKRSTTIALDLKRKGLALNIKTLAQMEKTINMSNLMIFLMLFSEERKVITEGVVIINSARI